MLSHLTSPLLPLNSYQIDSLTWILGTYIFLFLGFLFFLNTPPVHTTSSMLLDRPSLLRSTLLKEDHLLRFFL